MNWVIPVQAPPHAFRVVSRFVVEADGTVSDCQRVTAEGAPSAAAPIGKIDCPSKFSRGLPDAAGKPVRQQLIYTQSLAIEPVSPPAPAPAK